MEEGKKKSKEYYQVNLDTGRIFWIAFILGIIVIGIFVLGFYIGGGKSKKGIFDIDKYSMFRKEKIEAEEEKEEIPLIDLIEDKLSEETRYIEIEDVEGTVKEIQKEAEEAPLVSVPQKKSEETLERVVKTVKREEIAKKSSYVARGDYYIQVASFSKEENAKSLVESLQKKLYKVVIEKAQVGGKTYYRVRVGPFETEGVATNTMISMKKRFNLKDPFVVKKKS